MQSRTAQPIGTVLSILVLLAAPAAAQTQWVPALDDLDDPSVDGVTDVTDVTGWNPRSIDPLLCESPEFEPSLPPENGACDIEIWITETEFTKGQGFSEGKGEISTVFRASYGNPPTAESVEIPESVYSVGETKGHDVLLGTWEVQTGHALNVWVCADFTEHDGGGANGDDDLGRDCANVLLECDPSRGAPTQIVDLGPANLCGPNQCNGSASAQLKVVRADADGDNVANEDDFTPEPCDEEEKGENGIGLVLYFHYDDNGLITLGQAAYTNLSLFFPVYDRVVLVADSETSNPLDLNGGAFSGADRVYPPTQEGLLDAMQYLTAEGMRFDVKVHAHGYKNGDKDSEFETLEGTEHISGKSLMKATKPDVIGTERGGVPIVAWWSTTCIAERQIDAWEKIGAVVANGARDVQFFPNEWMDYITAWVTGARYRDAVEDARTWTVITDASDLIQLQGSGLPWLCLPSPVLPDGVLGNNACADDFFQDVDGKKGPDEGAYKIQEVYDPSLSGFENMLVSSERAFIGDDQIRFGAPTATWP
ncbi:MAG: hypothetical protein QNK03_25560 [Myxococcota bacterium]|nr:hypothetical protein [Myxococcota bacterium]